MSKGIHWKIVRFLTWFLARLSEEPKLFEQNLETSMKTLDRLWQTLAVHQYLDGREAYLRDSTVNAVLSGNVPDSKYFAGRLHEVQEFRAKLKAAHVYTAKKRDALAKASK